MGDDTGVHFRGIADTGDNSIEVQLMVRGQRERTRLAWKPTEQNLRRAFNKRKAALLAIKEGTFTWAVHFPDSKQAREEKPIVAAGILTLGVALDKSLALSVKHVTKGTLQAYTRDAIIWKRELGADIDVNAVTKVAALEAIARAKIGNKRVTNFLIPLRAAMQYAVDDKKLAVNPIDSLKVRKIRQPRKPGQHTHRPDKRPRPFLVSEVRLLETAPHGAYWKLWAEIGTRPEEYVAIKWANVRADGLYIVEAKTAVDGYKETKTLASERRIELTARAREALDVLRPLTGHQAYVLLNPNTNAPFHDHRPIRLLFHRDCTIIGMRARAPSLFRHTFASWNLEAGESITWLAGQMGHTTPEELMKDYWRHIPENTDRPGSRLAAALAAGRDLGAGVHKPSLPSYPDEIKVAKDLK